MLIGVYKDRDMTNTMISIYIIMMGN